MEDEAQAQVTPSASANIPLENPIDWRGVMQPVRNQGGCGSCWAFSAAGALEGHYNLKYGQLSDHVSTQQLVDCVSASYGCGGGFIDSVYNYYKDNDGAVPEQAYPYEESDGNGCRLDNSQVFINQVTGHDGCDPYGWFSNTRCSLQRWLELLKKGPLGVVLASGEAFQYYNGGIIDPRRLSCQNSDHAVVAVGWRLDQRSNRNVITIRNSWGDWWGEKGHFQIFHTEDNVGNGTCWVTRTALAPILG